MTTLESPTIHSVSIPPPAHPEEMHIVVFKCFREYESLLPSLCKVCIGNSMICWDIWHKYHEWYFEIVSRNFMSHFGEWNLRQFWNIRSGIYAKYHLQIMILFVDTTTHKRFVIFTRRYFKLSWNTTALSQSKWRNFSCSTIRGQTDCILKHWNIYNTNKQWLS